MHEILFCPCIEKYTAWGSTRVVSYCSASNVHESLTPCRACLAHGAVEAHRSSISILSSALVQTWLPSRPGTVRPFRPSNRDTPPPSPLHRAAAFFFYFSFSPSFYHENSSPACLVCCATPPKYVPGLFRPVYHGQCAMPRATPVTESTAGKLEG